MMHMHHDDETPRPTTLPCACTALRKASRAVSRLYDEAMAGSGLTTTQLAILRSLGRTGTTPLSRLADSLVMDRTSLYRALPPLLGQGLMTVREADRGKAKLADLTDAGRDALETAAPFWEAAQQSFVNSYGPQAWLSLFDNLQTVIATSTRLDGPSSPGSPPKAL
jgi:DNA-binding MarR family transcriptional regulator